MSIACLCPARAQLFAVPARKETNRWLTPVGMNIATVPEVVQLIVHVSAVLPCAHPTQFDFDGPCSVDQQETRASVDICRPISEVFMRAI